MIVNNLNENGKARNVFLLLVSEHTQQEPPLLQCLHLEQFYIQMDKLLVSIIEVSNFY